MPDPRLQKLAQLLINYSLEIRPGDKLRITSAPAAAPLLREVYREALRAGAYPTVRIEMEELTELSLRVASPDQLRYVSDIDRQEVEYFDATLNILADENTKALSSVAAERMAARQQARAPLLKRRLERAAQGELRWCLTLFPTQAYAQDASMSLEEYQEFVFAAGRLNEPDPAAAWREVEREQQRLADYLAKHDRLHFLAPGTDLSVRVGGRTWMNSCGHRNFPDGETFTGPIEDSANGTVRFTYPAIYGGREVEGIRLTFQDGRVVEATADKGEDYLQALLDQDPGARYLGEVAFGLNYNIRRFTGDILFDEKIGGTFHIALGQSYPQTGGRNQSGLHWDLICDLREGEVFADGERCCAGGRFAI